MKVSTSDIYGLDPNDAFSGVVDPNNLSREDVIALSNATGLDMKDVDLEELRKGIKEEFEHEPGDFHESNEHILRATEIAWGHLMELPDYYTQLEKREGEGGESELAHRDGYDRNDGHIPARRNAALKNAQRKRSVARVLAMQLLTQKDRKNLPDLYAQDGKGQDAIAYVKFFTPDANWTWYATEFDGRDTFFGLVFGQSKELGYFSLRELQSVRGRLGLPVERDRSFKPTALKNLRR